MRKGNVEQRKQRVKKRVQQKKERIPYTSAAEYQTIEEKQRILDQLGKPELINLFKDWQPQMEKRRAKKQGPPLDQRVAISVTKEEKDDLQLEINRIRKTGDAKNVSEFIRGRATGSVDIVGWRENAEELLKKIDTVSKDEKRLKRRRATLRNELEELDEDNVEDSYVIQKRLREVISQIESVEVQHKKRAARLSGRMTTPESETIKWRASRLNLSVSDYLRFCLFNHDPGGSGDAHLSVDAKKRFYIGVIDVAENGWGEPPQIHSCQQCIHYRTEMEKAKHRVKQLESFLPDD